MAAQIRQWWTASDPSRLLASEHRLLSALVRHPFRKPGGNDDRGGSGGMNLVDFRVSRASSSEKLPTVVLAHGFGSGLSFFYRNIDQLLDSGRVARVVCVDWMGMGGSARPPCWESPIRSLFGNHQDSSCFSLCNSRFSSSQAVDFFLDPFDRVLRNGDLFDEGEPIWLVGHSLGGYLTARYTMRIHEQLASDATAATAMPNLTKLVLASPVGFQPLPPPHERIAPSNFHPALRLVDVLWSANLTPQSLVRLMGSSRGRNAVKRALNGRIPHLAQQNTTQSEGATHSELNLLAEYLYHITVAPASGEYALNSLLEPAASEAGAGVYAREPLGGGSMAEVISRPSPSPLESIKVLFGDNDWMRFHEPASREEMQAIDSMGGKSAVVHLVPQAGHHLYLDNAPSFVRHILED